MVLFRRVATLVRTFAVNRRLTFTLRCGNEAGGYRHIVIRHRGDDERSDPEPLDPGSGPYEWRAERP